MANDEPRAPENGSATSDNQNDAPHNVLQKLRESTLFSQLSDEEFKLVTELLRTEQVAQGVLLIQQGGLNTNLYILRRGRAAIRRVSLNNVEELVGFVNVGGVFNEYAFLSGFRNTQTVEALDPLTLWYIRRDEFQELLDEYPDLESHLVYPSESDPSLPQQERQVRTFSWQRPGERVLLYRKKHIWVFLSSLLPLVLVFAVVAILMLLSNNGQISPLVSAILTGLAVLSLVYVVLRFVDWQNDYYAVTDLRVLRRERVLLIHDEQDEVPLGKIQDVTITRPSLFSLTFDFGDVTIEAMGARSRVRFRDVPKPDQVGELIFQLLKRTGVESLATQRAKIRAELRQELGLGSGSSASVPQARRINTYPQIKVRVQMYRDSVRALRNTLLPYMRLEQGGSVIYRKHWLRLVQTITLPTLIGLLYGLFLYFIATTAPDLKPIVFGFPFVIVTMFIGAALMFWWVYRYEDWRNDIYIVTSERIIDIDRSPFGLRGSKRREAKLSAVQNVTYQTSGFVDMLFNMGDVIIHTAGGEGKLTFDSVLDPRRVQHDIVDRIEQFDATTREKQSAQRRQEMTEWLGIYDELTRLHERRKLG
jgi:membrane protein YdbS with pleckstrin-like domain